MSGIYSLLRGFMLPIREIDLNLPKQGTIMDLGCGEGVIASELARRQERSVIGLDADAARVEAAARRYRYANIRFVCDDLTRAELPDLDGAVISDVLHHLTRDEALDLLARIYAALPAGGVLVIKEVDGSERIRTALSRFWDKVLYPDDKPHYFTYQELQRFLAGLGFGVKMSRPLRVFPGSTTLYVCRKSAA